MNRPTTGHSADHIAHEISRDITRRTLVTSSLAIVCLAAQDASAQAWPARPIKIIVRYAPGGSSDIIARAISQPLSEALKQSVIVENRAGGQWHSACHFGAA